MRYSLCLLSEWYKILNQSIKSRRVSSAWSPQLFHYGRYATGCRSSIHSVFVSGHLVPHPAENTFLVFCWYCTWFFSCPIHQPNPIDTPPRSPHVLRLMSNMHSKSCITDEFNFNNPWNYRITTRQTSVNFTIYNSESSSSAESFRMQTPLFFKHFKNP